MLNKELLNYQDRLFWVYRRVKQSHVKTEKITDLKEYWRCDLVLRSRHENDENLIFLREIEDAKIVKDLI
jgi:hypothetical protein